MHRASLPPVDLDLRLVRSFTAVAEHRHFGRAAAALHTTQPALSRQIRRLERELGVGLLDRTPRGTDLTEAGEVFLPLARTLLRSAEQAVALTRAATRAPRIAVGYTTNLVVTQAVAELRRRHPEADVRTRHLGWNRARTALLDRQVDVVLARMPFDTDDLDVTVLYREPRVLMVPTGHRLAGKDSVTVADFADEPLPRVADERWNAFWRIDPRPDGRPAPDGPLVEDVEDKVELVASWQALAIVPAGEHLDRLRPDLTSVALDGVEPAEVVLATRDGDRNPLLAAFREVVHLAVAPDLRQGPGER
ncbi:LysR family transcriptional regulator [Nocardia sp. NRRL S-836]|uniref:LysR family transcriptional regulator n=1 Tax=Nocardia sp. NRRL S-836 TaxID=1519492 RepID=UPI0006B026BB|nr:LysR family transcriptional regulator [Nocardia sp. NRRL S-836]KOV85247.1 LysR family transcriptional regulator [Nocardia sp. NRRL S-836]